MKVAYKQYSDEHDLPMVMHLVDNELSEPYSIFTYRYFLVNWPHLCFLALDGDRCFGVVVAKMDIHRNTRTRGYIAMLVVEHAYRSLGIGSELVVRVLREMAAGGCQEVVLEAEVTNRGALRLYERLGFLRDKRLRRYYLNGSDAYRLKLLLQGNDNVAHQQVELGPQGDEALQAAEQLQQLQFGKQEYSS